MISFVHGLIRKLLHALFNVHWFTIEEIGVRNPKAFCEFCNAEKRLLDDCEKLKPKHRWKLYGVSGLVTTKRHYVCTTCGAKAESLELN